MTEQQYHITSSCIIRNSSVVKNSDLFFRPLSQQPADLLVELYQHLSVNYPRFYKMDHLCKLGWLASEILLQDGLTNVYQPEEVGLVLSNANSSLDTDSKYQSTISEIPSPSVFVYTLPNIVTGEICIRNHFKGENAFFITSHFDTQLIYSYVNGLLQQGILQACICGWADWVDEKYSAALYLVEKTGNGNPFSQQELDRLFDPQ